MPSTTAGTNVFYLTSQPSVNNGNFPSSDPPSPLQIAPESEDIDDLFADLEVRAYHVLQLSII